MAEETQASSTHDLSWNAKMEYSRPSRPGYPAPRRVATAPIPLSTQFAAASPPSDGVVETLYNHPNAKIISFTASGRAFSRSLGRSSMLPVDDEPGTLSWSSQLERTIAVGPFRIYRAPGSVAFLNCGSALQPILPKSQCWCIDEVNSKFILQIRRPNYWRIELPVSNPEDQHRAQNLRGVLDQILQFEKTECPFKRSFTVVLPERPQTPVKKRPWTPVRRSLPATPATDPESPVPRSTSIVSRSRPSTPLNVKNSEQDANESLPTQPGSPVLHLSSSNTEVDSQSKKPTGQSTDVNDEGSLMRPLQAKGEPADHNESGGQDPNLERCHDVAAAFNSGDASAESEIARKIVSHSLQELKNETASLGLESEGPPCKNRAPGESSDVPVPAVESPLEPSAPAEDDVLIYELHEGSGYKGEQMKTRLRRRTKFALTRSVTSPPQLSLAAETPAKLIEKPTHAQLSLATGAFTKPTEELAQSPQLESVPAVLHVASEKPDFSNAHAVDVPQLTRRGSEDSFHSVQSWHSLVSPPPPSPPTSHPDSPTTYPYPHQEIFSPKQQAMNGYIADETVISDTMTSWDAGSNEGSEASDESVATAPDGTVANNVDKMTNSTTSDGVKSKPVSQHPAPCHRPTTSSISVRRRALSPLPSAANLFSPTSTMERRQPYRSKLETVKKLPLAIIAKTCEMIMGPPSHLIALMLNVAAKIAAGEWRGVVYGYNDSGEQIPVQWDYSEGDFSDWSDDGFAGETAEASDDNKTWSVD